MPSLEKLQKRTLDRLLIETIKRVGVSNYSLVARLTGINAETVRYKINKQLGRYGLRIFVNVNYSELGFVLGHLSVKASPNAAGSWIDHSSYLTLVGKAMGTDRFVGMYAIPNRFKSKYFETLSFLKEKNFIEDFELTELYWLRYPSFRSEFYDFENQVWKVDWKRVDLTSGEVGVTLSSVNRDSKVDYIDLMILRSLQEDPTTNPAKIAKLSNMNARTVRYHHLEHVLKGNLILSNNTRWAKPMIENKPSQIMQAAYSFKKLNQQDYEVAKSLFNKIPFTWLESGSEDRSYFAFLDIPIENFHETIGFVESRIQNLKTKPEIAMLDPAKTKHFNLSDEMFDRKRGWRLPNYQSPSESGPSDSRPDIGA